MRKSKPMLPVEDGAEFLRIAQEDEALRAICVIVPHRTLSKLPSNGE
jgi:hypothetical protein